jgi:hypothetical protein
MSTLKDPLPRSESELGRNRIQKGDQSYYYAHNEGWTVPQDAVVRSGPGLVTGGAPVPLGPDGEPVQSCQTKSNQDEEDDVRDAVIAQLRSRIDQLERDLVQSRSAPKALTQYSFSDEGAKCKVYVEVGAGLLEPKSSSDEGVTQAEAAVVVNFSKKICSLRVLVPKADGTVAERLAVNLACQSEVLPEKCSYRIDRAKGRVTLVLKKENEAKAWSSLTTTPM